MGTGRISSSQTKISSSEQLAPLCFRRKGLNTEIRLASFASLLPTSSKRKGRGSQSQWWVKGPKLSFILGDSLVAGKGRGGGTLAACRSLSKHGYCSSQVEQQPCLKVMARSWAGHGASQSAPESWTDSNSSWEQPGSQWRGCFAVRSPNVLFFCIYVIFQAES